MTPNSSPLQRVPGEPDAVSSDPEVHSITDAAGAHSEDMRQRMIKYAVAMGIRMVCIVMIFVVDGWFKVIAIAGAVFLPWFAVVIANGSDKAEIHSDSLLDDVAMPEIQGPSQPARTSANASADESPVVLQGELVEDDDTMNQPAPSGDGASDAGGAGDERATR